MASFVVTTPDGRKFEVTAPDNTSPQGVLEQFASGTSRGVLGTLDILPKGLVGGAKLLGFEPEWRGTPFQNIGGSLGLGQRVPQSDVEEQAEFAGAMLGGSMLPAVGLTARAKAPAQVLATETAALLGATGGGIAGGEMGGDLGQLAGTVAGGFAPVAAPWAARLAVAPTQQRQIPARVAAAQRQGIPITAGQAAGGSDLEKASSLFPGARRLSENFQERQAQAFGRRIDEMAGQLTPREASQEAAGRAIRQGIEGFGDVFRTRGNEMYNAVHALIPEGTPVALRRTRDKLEDLIMDEEFSTILDAPLVRQLSKALSEREAVPYEVAHAIRSRIGDRLATPELIVDAPKGQLKALYGSLSDDLDDVARAIGPDAERAASRASRFWKAGMGRIESFLDPIQKRGIPEDVFKAAMAGTKEGASRIRSLKKSLEPAQWNTVVATVVRRLGRAIPSQRTTTEIIEETTDFSPETFLTNLERLDSKARKALFSGSRYAGLEQSLADLMSVAQGVRQQNRAAFNPSGTAAGWFNAAGYAAPFAAGLFDPVLAAKVGAGVGANAALQRALQSPQMVNWLANPTRFQPSLAGQAARIHAYLNRQ